MFNFESKIKFLCDPKLKGVIPEPYPAKKYIPEWYKRLNTYAEQPNKVTPLPTLKRCPPFLDAMCAGWIIPLAADLHIKTRDNGTGISWESDFIFKLVETHNQLQIATHPKAHKIPLKFLNHWIVQTPPGWSCIFTPPLNRPDENIELLSGIVETDKYFEFVNFPGLVRLDNDYIKLPRGYPLMQVIPFKRDYKKDADVRTMSDKELKKLQLTRDRRSSEFSYYRDNLWEKKI